MNGFELSTALTGSWILEMEIKQNPAVFEVTSSDRGRVRVFQPTMFRLYPHSMPSISDCPWIEYVCFILFHLIDHL